jgi:hypothetical protein
MAALAEAATPGLLRMGFGPARIQAKYIPIRSPNGIW